MNNYYELLYQCYRSRQMSERQWQEHLREKRFKEWVLREKINHG